MPDIFLSKTQLLAVGFLERCVRDLEPLAVLTGDAGTGKTVALNTMLARSESTSTRIIRVNNFVAGPLSLHRVLASALGVADAGYLTAEALEPALRRALAEAGRSRPPVLAVDDAQSLLPETLRYLCLLAGLREAGRPLLRILLIGRPGFTIRQSMPRQFSLEALATDDARRLVLHRFALAGINVPDEAVHDIVRDGQGNLRKLDLLLGAATERARTAGRGRKASGRKASGRGQMAPGQMALGQMAPGQMAIGTPSSSSRNSRSARRSIAGRWPVVPALLVVGAAALAIAHHEGMFDGRDQTVVAAAMTPPAPVAADTPPPSAEAPASIPPVPVPAPVLASPSAPVPVASVPPPTADVPPAPVTAAVSPPATLAPPAAAPPSVMTPPVVASQPVAIPSATSLATTPATTPEATHFRVYNISACHQGICPRWSVTDLDQQQHFVAAFNPATLHLDRDMLRRLREGSLDLVVSGSVAQGRDGRTLSADALDEVVAHHGRIRSSSSPSEPVELAPPLRSPPPGFLPVLPPEH